MHIINAYFIHQAWVARILLKYGEDTNTEHDFEMTKLLDGRALCRVANTIMPGSVETIHHDKFHNVRDRTPV